MGGISRNWYAYQYTGGGGGGSSLLTNLVSYWKLDEVSNGSAPVTRIDSVTATGNDLTDNNTTASGVGIIGNASSHIAGNNETLTRADNASLQVVGTDFTFAAWVNLTDLLATYGIGTKSNGSSGEWACYAAVTTGSVHLQIYTAGVSQIDLAGPTITAGAWHFIVVDYATASKALSITVDNGAPTGGVNPGTGPSATVGPFTIGNRTNANFLSGLVDEVGFWKRLLTAPERTSLYNGGAGLSYPF